MESIIICYDRYTVVYMYIPAGDFDDSEEGGGN